MRCSKTAKNLKWVPVLLVCLMGSGQCMGQDAQENSNNQPAEATEVSNSISAEAPADFNSDIFYRNKLEFSVETGVLPVNIPFAFDFLVGGNYNTEHGRYILVPTFASFRWQMGDVRGPSILRGNNELTLTGSFTAIPKGPETRYGAFDLGVRRNFVQRNWKTVPYFELIGGAGFINAKGPEGIDWAQGGDFTFTIMVGSGMRYNFNPRYSMFLGINYMHVSDAYLCHPAYCDNGINVVGPMFGFSMRISKPRQISIE